VNNEASQADTLRPGALRPVVGELIAPTADTRLLSAADLARELGFSVRTIRRLDLEGKLPRPIRVGVRAVRWRRAEVAAWIRAGCPVRERWIWETE
jgi:predicted DNA-binding transcriptional regulator AlpA